MSKKDVTLLGAIGRAVRATRGIDPTENCASVDDVREIVKEMVTKTYIESLDAVSAEPTTLEVDAKNTYFFLNGTPAVIMERDDGAKGAKILAGGKEYLVDDHTHVFGGRHNDDTLTNSEIIMYGGTLANVFGGGLHKSHTCISRVTVYGGFAKSFQGGGASGLEHGCGCEL